MLCPFHSNMRAFHSVRPRPPRFKNRGSALAITSSSAGGPKQVRPSFLNSQITENFLIKISKLKKTDMMNPGGQKPTFLFSLFLGYRRGTNRRESWWSFAGLISTTFWLNGIYLFIFLPRFFTSSNTFEPNEVANPVRYEICSLEFVVKIEAFFGVQFQHNMRRKILALVEIRSQFEAVHVESACNFWRRINSKHSAASHPRCRKDC